MFCQITMVLAESVRARALEMRLEAEKIGVLTRMQIDAEMDLREARPDDDHGAGEADQDGDPAPQAHVLAQEERRADGDEDRTGEAQRRDLGQRGERQGDEPQHHARWCEWRRARDVQRKPSGVQRAVEAEPEHDRQQEQRTEEIAQERHHVGVEVLRRNEREDVQQREQQARNSDPEDAAQIGRQRKPAGDESETRRDYVMATATPHLRAWQPFRRAKSGLADRLGVGQHRRNDVLVRCSAPTRCTSSSM